MKIDLQKAGTMDNQSTFHYMFRDQKPDDFGDDNHFVTDQRGYCVILKGIIEDLRNYVS